MIGYNFTERARKTLAISRDEAARLHHEYVGTEHILLGLIREGGGVGFTVLEKLGADPTRITEMVEETVKRGRNDIKVGPDLPYTSRAKKVLELAMGAARELNHSYVGSEHLLLALLREEKGIAAQVLASQGVTDKRVLDELERLYREGETAHSPQLAAPAHVPLHRLPITGAEYAPGQQPSSQNALAQFYAAFNTCDLELMAANWSQAPDVVMDNPLGGIARGWDEIRAIYQRIFDGPARVSVEFHDYTLHGNHNHDLFFAVGRERGTLERGKVLKLSIRTTRVFRRVAGVWRQVHHHGSIDDPEMLRAYQALVSDEQPRLPPRRR